VERFIEADPCEGASVENVVAAVVPHYAEVDVSVVVLKIIVALNSVGQSKRLQSDDWSFFVSAW
jgi:hypothetical protein